MFVVPPFFGHISPTLSVGADLLAKGHSVLWVGLRELPAHHLPAGGRWIVPPATSALHGEEILRILKRQDDGAGLSGMEVLKLAFEETYLPFCRFLMVGLPELTDQYAPDVIVSDCITFAGGLCAYKKGIPFVTSTPVAPEVMKGAMDMPRVLQWHRNLVMGLQREFGVFTDEAVVLSNDLNIVFTSREFAGVPAPPPQMKFVGPVKGRPDNTPFDWERFKKLPGPRIFISLGTLLRDIRPAYFQKMIQAFGHQPLGVIAATDPGILPEWPDNFLVQDYVPQSLLLSRVNAVICHGGFNTINDAIFNQLPILITPITYDHFHNAALIVAAGCGIQLRYKRLRIDDLKSAVWSLLENEKYAIAARKHKDYFLSAGGNARAVEYLEEFAGARRVMTMGAVG